MRWLRHGFGVGCFALALAANLLAPVLASANASSSASAPVIREINITGDEFVVVQNPSNQPLALGDYWLGYTSDASATAGPSEQLPSVTLAENETLVLSNGPVDTCGAVAAGDLPFALANTAGTLALWHYNSSASPASFGLISSLSWDNKTATSSNHLNINDEDRVDDYASKNPGLVENASWLLPLASTDQPSPAWQVGNLASCNFAPVDKASKPQNQQRIAWPASNEYPPFTMLPTKFTGSSGGSGPSLPASDAGLKAPMINELLPNPAKPQTDAKDEFIELYNPNSASFDLNGFQLETGSTTSSSRHNYSFPAGTKIGPKGFKAFKSGDTSISLTNNGGQVWLLDPFGKIISKSGVYGQAKDGLAFAMAKGKWYWTLLPTPGKANSIQQPGKTSGSSASQKTATVKGKPVTAIKGASTSSSSNLSGSSTDASDETPSPIHPAVLAVVAVLALGYGLYEYRNDLGNKFHQLRKYRAARRANRR